MEKLKIILEPDSLVCSSRGTVTGVFYVQAGTVTFPGDGWDDLCCSVLDMWLQAVTEYFVGYREECELYFMDGDYHMQWKRLNSAQTQVCFIQDDNQCLYETVIDPVHFARQLLSAAEILVNRFPQLPAGKKVQEHAQALRNCLQALRKKKSPD